MVSDMLTKLRDSGWAKVHLETRDMNTLGDFLTTAANQLGTPIHGRSGTVEKITPKRIEQANPNSLSGKYGLGPFPLHCDTSQWITPCRFVLLACANPGTVPIPTLLLDTHEVTLSPYEQEIGTTSVCLVLNGRNSFYSSVLSKRRQFIRYDPGCMTALDGKSQKAMGLYSHVARKDYVREVCMDAGDILVLDNWRILHGRGECTQVASSRILLRSLVK